MATLAELLRLHTKLDSPRLAHLQRLVASWGPLADLCFADLLLFVPVDEDDDRFVVAGQVRPTTNQTVYRQDFVGEIVDEVERPLVARTFRTEETTEGEVNAAPYHDRVRVLAIPVRWQNEVIAVLTRESLPSMGREPGDLERTYLDVFHRFARMIASGTFPFAHDDAATEEAPRVGDGTLLLGPDGRVEYASPNAVSALHKIGVHANAEGVRLGDLGLDDVVIRTAMVAASPVTQELERGEEVTVLLRCLPLVDDGKVTGALVLLRDISELRRRDRLLHSMDATIREIHHRVKNNLQTISSLLRLQGRRLASAEAKEAVEESVRRIRSIALVHETLSRETGDDVSFNEIVRPLVRMVEESLLSSPDRPVAVAVEGDGGMLPARIATPLAVVLNELLQNAVDHAYPHHADAAGEDDAGAVTTRSGQVTVRLANDGSELYVLVLDDGVGLPEGFDLDQTDGLGLSIVRNLVTSQLQGSIKVRPAREGYGTAVDVRIPLHPEPDAA